MRRPRQRLLVTVLAGLALVLAACGGGDDTADGGDGAAGAGTVTFVGNDEIQWEETEKTAEAVDGELEVTIVCDGVVPHNLVIGGVEGDGEIVRCEGDDEATATISIEPGTYDFWCSVPGHREAGMEGVLTVS